MADFHPDGWAVTLIRIALADILAERRRTVLSLAGIVPIVVAFLLLLGVAAGLSADLGSERTTNIVVMPANVLDPASGRLDPSVPITIVNTGGDDVAAVSPVIFRPIQVDGRILQLRGVPERDWAPIHGLTLLAGSWPELLGEIAVTDAVTSTMGWKVGSTAEFLGSVFRISGVVAAPGTKFASVWMPFGQARRVFGDSAGFQMVVVQTRIGSDPVAMKQRLATALGDDAAVFFEAELAAQQSSRLGRGSGLSVLASAIGVTALTFGVFNLSALGLSERMRDVGIARALGFRRRTIAAFVATRSALVAAAGYVAGAAATAAFLATRPPQSLRSFVIEFHIPWHAWLLGAALTIAAAAIGAVLAQLPLTRRPVLNLLDAS